MAEVYCASGVGPMHVVFRTRRYPRLKAFCRRPAAPGQLCCDTKRLYCTKTLLCLRAAVAPRREADAFGITSEYTESPYGHLLHSIDPVCSTSSLHLRSEQGCPLNLAKPGFDWMRAVTIERYQVWAFGRMLKGPTRSQELVQSRTRASLHPLGSGAETSDQMHNVTTGRHTKSNIHTSPYKSLRTDPSTTRVAPS